MTSFNCTQHSYGVMDKLPNIVDDLRCTIEYITMGIVNVVFHSLQDNSGNLWTIQGPKKNLMVMIHYKTDAEVTVEKGFVDVESSIKKEVDENSVVCTDIQEANLHDQLVDVSNIFTNVTDNAECVLPHGADVDGLADQVSALKQSLHKNTLGRRLDAKSNCTHSLSYEHDLTYSKGNVSKHANSCVQNTIQDLTSYSNCKTDNISEGKSYCSEVPLEESKIFVNYEIPIIREDAVNCKALELLDKSNICECVTSNEPVVSFSSESKDEVCLSSLNQCMFDKKAMKLKQCSVLLEPLDISALRNNYLGDRQEQYEVDKQIKTEIENDASVQCCHCGKRFTIKDNLEAHVQCTEMTYRCSACDEMFNDACDLNDDVKFHPDNDKIFHCAGCRTSFHDLDRFNAHMQEKHFRNKQCEKIPNANRPNSVQENKKIFVCLLCDKRFRTNAALEEHTRYHTGEKPYQCLLCNKKFYTNGHLKRHMLIHSTVRSYECSQCEKTFDNKSDLHDHKKIHPANKPFECLVCSKKFYRRSHLEEHNRYHTGERPYQCLQCNKHFYTKGHLKRHKRFHSGETPLHCSLCDKKFYSRDAFKRHSLSHSELVTAHC